MPFASKHYQNGAAMVEMALIIMLFLLLIFWVFEFALAVFFAARLSEATREGAGYAIVSNAMLPLRDSKGDLIPCDTLRTRGPLVCDDSVSADDCTELKARMQRVVPTLDFTKVKLEYLCVDTGYSDAKNQVYSVTVMVDKMPYSFITSSLKITMPTFATTRISEDMWSRLPPGN